MCFDGFVIFENKQPAFRPSHRFDPSSETFFIIVMDFENRRDVGFTDQNFPDVGLHASQFNKFVIHDLPPRFLTVRFSGGPSRFPGARFRVISAAFSIPFSAGRTTWV
jgi:hypothetical protein